MWARLRNPAGGALAGAGLAMAGLLVACFAWARDARWLELHATRLACITDTRALRLFAAERWVGIVAGALLVAAAWPASRVASRMPSRALAGAVGRIALAAVLALVVSEGVLRVVHPVGPPKLMTNLPTADADSKLGWRYRPRNTKVTELPGDALTVTYDVDADGNRARSTTDIPDYGAPAILFAGESITAGIGVSWGDTYPALVASRLGVQGVNLGVHGYGTDQVYLRTLEALERYAQPIAVVTLFVADELERSTAAERRHLVVSRDGALVWDHTPVLWRESALRDLLRRAIHYDDGEEIALARAIFRSTAGQVRARHGVPLFVMTNFGPRCLPDASGAPALEHVLFDDLDAPHLRVDLDARLRLRDDPHPNAVAVRMLADAIARALSGALAHHRD